MDIIQQSKSTIGSFYENWLNTHFSICRPEDLPIPLPNLSIKPDRAALTNPVTLIEIKTRSFHGNKNRTRDYWWPCMVSQVKGYDQAVRDHNLRHAWVFLLAEVDQSLERLAREGIAEHNILARRIYIAPHGIEKVASNYGKPGLYYHLSAPRLDAEGFLRVESHPGLELLLHPELESSLADCFRYA
jgi:hypothetical protein